MNVSSVPFLLIALLRGWSALAAPFSIGFESGLELNEAELRELDRIGNEILERCPPQSCIAVGVGRSPTPLYAWFEARAQGNRMLRLPLSRFRFASPAGYQGPFRSSFKDLLNEPSLQTLHRQFQKNLPKPSELNGRRLLLVDFAVSGRSLTAVASHIDAFYQLQGVQAPVELLALVPASSLNSVADEFAQQIQSASKRTALLRVWETSNLSDQLNQSQFDTLSPIEKFELQPDSGTAWVTPPDSNAFQLLVTHLKKWLAVKPASDGCLAPVVTRLGSPQ